MKSNVLKGKMREKGIIYKDLSEKLKLCLTTVNRKINNITPFTIVETKQIKDILKFIQWLLGVCLISKQD